MSDVQEQDDFEPSGYGNLGCCNCELGWKHGCCDDMCRYCNEGFYCEYARPCELCNPEGDCP